MYMLNQELIALVIREIFTGYRKFKSRSPKLGHVPFHLVFCMHQNYSLSSVHTPNLKSLAFAVPKIQGPVY